MDKVLKKKVMFSDLDGTLIDTLSGETFPQGIIDMKFKLDTLRAIKNYKPSVLVIVSNQGGVTAGYVRYDDFASKEKYILHALREYLGLEVHCFCCYRNEPDNPMRKPNTDMLDHALSALRIYSKDECMMIGDASGLPGQYSDTDIKTALNFGIDYQDVQEFTKAWG